MSNALAIVPRSVEEVRSLSTAYAKSSLLPPELKGKEADIFVTVLAGLELGMAPMAALRSIHVIKGKPVLSADGMVAVALSSGNAEYFRCVESNDQIATYETKRKGAPEPQRLSFTMAEAKAAKLGGDNWSKYPAAMLRARAKAALCRDAYPDALAGVYIHEEAREFNGGVVVRMPITGEPADATVIEGNIIEGELVDEAEAEIHDETHALMDRIMEANSADELAGLVAPLSALPEGDGKRKARTLYREVARRLQDEREAQR